MILVLSLLMILILSLVSSGLIFYPAFDWLQNKVAHVLN
jgi:hypothetical protein